MTRMSRTRQENQARVQIRVKTDSNGKAVRSGLHVTCAGGRRTTTSEPCRSMCRAKSRCGDSSSCSTSCGHRCSRQAPIEAWRHSHPTTSRRIQACCVGSETTRTTRTDTLCRSWEAYTQVCLLQQELRTVNSQRVEPWTFVGVRTTNRPCIWRSSCVVPHEPCSELWRCGTLACAPLLLVSHMLLEFSPCWSSR